MMLRPGGTVNGVYYNKASNRRPAVISVRLDQGSANRFCTRFSLEGKDFFEVYQQAMEAVSGHVGIRKGSAAQVALFQSADGFLRRYKLAIRPITITYYQAEPAEPSA